MILDLALVAAMVPAQVYGYGERYCGDPGKPVSCSVGATTASGTPFNPMRAHVAVPSPKNLRLRKGKFICFMHVSGSKVYLPWTDKKKWKGGHGGFDFSPRAVEMLGHKPTKHWSAKIKLCPTNMGYSAI